jgi:cell division septation protein DedD
VVLGGRTAEQRNRRMASLLDTAFAGECVAPVLVASAPHKGRLAKLAAAVNPISEAEAAAITPDVASGWAVQVGAFAARGQARSAAEGAARLAGLKGRPVLVMASPKSRRLFRAVVGGMASSDEAREVCERLRRQDHACLAVPLAGQS